MIGHDVFSVEAARIAKQYLVVFFQQAFPTGKDWVVGMILTAIFFSPNIPVIIS
jgi:hypothetical protein